MNDKDKGLRLENVKGKWRIIEFSYKCGRVLRIIKKESAEWDYKSLCNYFQGYQAEYRKQRY